MRKTILLGGLAALSLTVAGGVAVAQQAQQQPAPRHARGDADGDGRVSRAEFVEARIARLTAADADRDGTVTAEEMRAAMQAQRAQRVAARFDRLDADKNGQISREEFSARPDRGPRGDGPRMQRGGRHHGGGMHGQKAGRGGERGPVVIAEARARAEQAFARMDTNSDGYVVAAERQAAMQQMRQQRQERRAQRQASPSTPASE